MLVVITMHAEVQINVLTQTVTITSLVAVVAQLCHVKRLYTSIIVPVIECVSPVSPSLCCANVLRVTERHFLE